jgi:hypothetical protein
MQTLNSLIPIVGILSLIFAIGALLSAAFPGNRMRRIKISGVLFAAFLAALIASPTIERAADKQVLTASGVSSHAELVEKQEQEEKERKAIEAVSYFDRVNAQIGELRELKARDFTDSVESIMLLLLVFEVNAQIIKDGNDLVLTPDHEKARQELKQLLSKRQVEILPVIRDAYGPALRKNLWEHDGYARTLGAGYRRIEIVNALFAANRNIIEFHNNVLATLLQLRFTRVDYKWIRQATEYSYFTLEPPSDGTIGYWNKSRFISVD